MRILILTAVLASGLIFSSVAVAGDAASTYGAKCAMCHGKDASGGAMAPALKGSDFISGDAEEIKDVIVNGRAGAAKKYKQFSIAMPKFSMSDEEASALVDYLKGL